MHSPFLGEVIATYFYTILGFTLVNLWNKAWLKMSYITMIFMGLINLYLLNSGFFMLSQYGWDKIIGDCFTAINK